MPLPVRNTSVRTNFTDVKKPATRSHQLPKPDVKSKQDINTEHEKTAETRSDDQNFSVTTVPNTANPSQTSSRIPSPLKRDNSSQPTRIHPVKDGQQVPPNKGHIRQRSTVVPPLAPHHRFGHARSISAVSINTTSPSSNDSRKPVLRPVSITAGQLSSSTKLKLGVSRPVSIAVSPASRAETIDPHQELLRNELLQLSIVHKASARTLESYQCNIERTLTTCQAGVNSKGAAVLKRKLVSSAALNACALDAWLQQGGYQKVCRSIQDLSIAVRDVKDLEQIFVGADGLATAFDQWQKGATKQAEPGTLNETNDDCTIVHWEFQETLLPQLQLFKQQLASSIASLTNLPSCSEMSSLCSTIRNHISLAESLRSQCQIMLQIGNTLVLEHRRWLRVEVATALSERKASNGLISGPTMTPVWET